MFLFVLFSFIGFFIDFPLNVFLQLSSTKPYIRKKAVLLMYKVFLSFPDALRPAFPRLKEKLEDPDPGIVSRDT
jgi:AP-3 complex subunit delta-1